MTAKNEELAVAYAALILQDDDVGITGEKIQAILKAANVEVEPYWPSLFAKALEGVDVKGLITSVSSGVGGGGGGPSAAAPAAAAAPEAKKEEKKKEEKKEEKEESDEDMGFGLFD